MKDKFLINVERMSSCGNLKLKYMKLDETKLQEVVEKIAYQQFRAEQIDDLYAKMGILNDYVQEQLRLFAVIKSVCVHPYEKVYQSETECYCEICGHDFTEQTVL